MKPKKKKNKEYMSILDRPIEELKKPMGQSVNFGKVITDVVRYNPMQHIMLIDYQYFMA